LQEEEKLVSIWEAPDEARNEVNTFFKTANKSEYNTKQKKAKYTKGTSREKGTV